MSRGRHPVAQWLQAHLVHGWVLVIAVWAAARDEATDAQWAVREGLAVLDGQALQHPDRWSWAPMPWDFTPTSPGWNALLAVAWRAAGWSGLVATSAAVMALSLLVVMRAARRLGSGEIATIVSLLITSVVAGALLTTRAGLPALALLLAAIDCTWARRERLVQSALPRAIAALAVIDGLTGFVGIWIHGSWTAYALALSIAQIAIVVSAVGVTFRRILPLGAVAAVAPTLGVLAGPFGADAWTEAQRVGSVCRGLVREWMSPWVVGTGTLVLWLLALAVALLLLMRAMRRSHERSGHYALVLAVLGTLAITAGAAAIRFMLIGVLLITPVLARELTTLLPATRLVVALGERGTPGYWRTIFALLLLPIAMVAALAVVSRDTGGDAAIAALPRNCNLFSNDEPAKRVELQRPDVRVWMDGRQDYWGRERITRTMQYLNAARPDGLVPAGTTCVLLERDPLPALTAALNASDAWQHLATSARFDAWALRTDRD